MEDKKKSWIVVKIYNNLMEAELDKNILDQAKIPAYLEGAGLAASNSLLINATQGIKLRVPEEKVVEVQAILEVKSKV